MNDWNPIETVPLGKPVLVTDGESVWFGRTYQIWSRKRGGHLEFYGCALDDAWPDKMPSEFLTGWQFAPQKMWEPEKTADEMFKEIEYHKVSATEYEDSGGDYNIKIENGGGIVKVTILGEQFYLSKREILACAQLIREMGWADA